MITFPLFYETKKNKLGQSVSKPSKPAIKGWNLLVETKDPWRKDQAVGIPCGEINDITVVDFDNKEIYNKFVQKFGQPNTKIVQTVRGYHVYFKYDKELPTTQIEEHQIDIRNDSGFVIKENSHQYIDGETYSYKNVNGDEINSMDQNVKEYLKSIYPYKQKKSKQSHKVENTNCEFEYQIIDRYTIQKTLDQLDPKNCDWRKVTLALKAIKPCVKHLWDEWSKRDPDNYNYENNLKIWNKPGAIHPNYLSNLIKAPSLASQSIKFDNELKPTVVMDQKYVTQYLDPKKMDLMDYHICSGTGTGKTVFASKTIQHRFADKRVLCITNRISLSAQQMNSFEPTKFTSYQDHPNYDLISTDPQNKLIICMNSLPKLKSTEYDLVYLDELTSLLKSTNGDHVQHRCLVLKTLTDVIKNAKYIISTDGDLDQTALDFIFAHRPNISNQVIQNTYQNAKGIKAYVIKTRQQMLTLFQHSVESGIYTITASDSKNQIVELKNSEILQGQPVRSYYKDCTRNIHVDLSNVNESWYGHHILFSPSVITGVDYTADTRDVFLWISANETMKKNGFTIDPYEMVQQIARARKIRNLYVYYNGMEPKPFMTTFSEFKEQQTKYFNSNSAMADGRLLSLEYNDPSYFEMVSSYSYEKEKLNSNQLYFVLQKLVKKGFDLQFIDKIKLDEKEQSPNHTHPNIEQILPFIENTQYVKEAKIDYENDKARVKILFPFNKNIYLPKFVKPEIDRVYHLSTCKLKDDIKKRMDFLEVNMYDVLDNPPIRILVECSQALDGYVNYWRLLERKPKDVDKLNPSKYLQFNMIIDILKKSKCDKLDLKTIDCTIVPEVDDTLFRKEFNVDRKAKKPTTPNTFWNAFTAAFKRTLGCSISTSEYFPLDRKDWIETSFKQIRIGDKRQRVYTKTIVAFENTLMHDIFSAIRKFRYPDQENKLEPEKCLI